MYLNTMVGILSHVAAPRNSDVTSLFFPDVHNNGQIFGNSYQQSVTHEFNSYPNNEFGDQ